MRTYQYAMFGPRTLTKAAYRRSQVKTEFASRSYKDSLLADRLCKIPRMGQYRRVEDKSSSYISRPVV